MIVVAIVALVACGAPARTSSPVENRARPATDAAVEPVETAAIAGRVLDAITGQPVPGAFVEVTAEDMMVLQTSADDRGEFRVEVVSPGRRTVTATAGDTVASETVDVPSKHARELELVVARPGGGGP
jgi:hypothetical protein